MTLREKMISLTNGKYIDDFDDITYADLEKYIDCLSVEDAILTMNHLFEYNFQRLKNRTVKVAFLVYSWAEWQCEEIYRAMEAYSQFDPFIIICGYVHGTGESIRNTYISTCSYFRKKAYNVIYMGYSDRWIERDILKEFDVLFYIIPYRFALVPRCLNVDNQCIEKILVHVPYAIYLPEPSVNYVEASPLFKMCWRCYSANELEKIFLSKKARLGGYNIVSVGHSKTDAIRLTPIKQRNDIWKKGATKIIWAPHFNMLKGKSSTFNENYFFFLDYAKNHPEISWVVKPHPRMEWAVLEYGVFSTSKEYYDYLAQWDALPNAKVLNGGDYLDYFMSSDALIHDSLTFMAEYMMTGHQQLRLLPEYPIPLNLVGQKIAEMIRTARGNDYSEIELFINDVKGKKDVQKEARQYFIDQFMRGEAEKKGMRCAEYILNELKYEIEK